MPPFRFASLRFFGLISRFLLIFGLLAAFLPAQLAQAGASVETAQPAEVAPRPLFTAIPAVTLGGLGTAPVGSNVSFTVQFKNNDTQTGYGPFIDLALDTTGPDGIYPGLAAADLYDGLGASLISASYLGVPFVLNSSMWVIPFDASGHASHPFARDVAGNPIVVTAPAGFTQGDKLVVFRLPFGSFVNSQPAAVVDVTVNMSPLADIGTDLNVAARGGFQFGTTALDDWCCDLVVDTISGWNTGSVKPTLFTLTKTYSGPENEAAAGPNFRTFYPMRYTVTGTIAPGQTVTNMVLTDVLPPNVQSFSLISSTPVGATCTTLPLAAPGGTLTCNWGATVISGSASFTFDFYIPIGVVPPLTGDDFLSCNNASSSAFWDSPDLRDADQNISVDPAGCEHTLTDKSIAVQKVVSVVGGGDPAPGKTLEYNLRFQVADFFAFQDVTVSDIISDGQHFDASFTPMLSVTEHGSTSSGDFNLANVTVDTSQIGNDTNPATNGTTNIIFNVSNELLGRGADTQLLGGCVPAGGGADVDCNPYNDGPTYGMIIFRSVIQENFTDTYPSGDPSVDQGDVLDDVGTINGSVLNTSDLTDTTNDEADGTAASVSIGYGTITKSVYALTDGNTGATTLNPASVKVKPGDKVTYKVDYTLPTSNFEGLVLTDYLPLPVFIATEVASFTNAVCNDLGGATDGVPAAGKACLGKGDTYHNLIGAVSSALLTDSAGNWVKWTYGNYDSANNPSSTIELVFTVTVQDDPFADGLYLTNQANATETSTQSNTSDGNSIVQILLTEPVLVGKKGIVASSNTTPSVVYAPAPPSPLAFNAPGTLGARWSGIINSNLLTTTPIDSNITGVDAGDLVTFAIVIQNNGSSINGAYDITIKDTLDAAGFEYPTPGVSSSINLRAAFGDSTAAPITYTQPGGGAATPGDLFGGGIKLDDPAAGGGLCQAHDPTTGNNVIIITYDLRVKSGIEPGTYSNTGAITNYSGTEGGPDFANPDLTDTATVTTAQPKLAKSATTEFNYAGNNNTQVVIGELVNYTLTVTVPEGVVNNAILTDTMDYINGGLTFVQVNSVTLSPGVTTSNTIGTGTIPTNVTIGNSGAGTGNLLTFDFGNITNTNTDNATAETITIVFQAVTLNVIGNQSGTVLGNVASFTASGVPAINTPAVNVTVVEPALTVDKNACDDATPPCLSVTNLDAGDPLTYIITVTNSGTTDAYDVTFSDPLPRANMLIPSKSWFTPTLATLSAVLSTGSVDVSSSFEIVGSDANGWILQTKSTSDIDLAPAEIITITLSGTVDYAAPPNAQLRNTGTALWTSLNGDLVAHPQERTGTNPIFQPNDYTNSSTVVINITNPLILTKSLVSTSEAHTSGSDVAIGEIVRYRLKVKVPEGTSYNLQLLDELPLGLTFLNDGTAKMAFVCTNTTPPCNVVSTTISGSSWVVLNANVDAVTPAYVLNDVDISNNTTSNTDIYSSGTDVYFKFGNLTNNANDANDEYVLVEFNALVDNSIAGNNNNGNTRTNDFIAYEGIPSARSGVETNNSVLVTVREPNIPFGSAKTITPPALTTGYDAGDTVPYTVTYTNTGAATAFDVRVEDTLNSVYFTDPASITIDLTDADCVPLSDTNNSAGNKVDITVSPVPVNCTVVIYYMANLKTSVVPLTNYINTATIKYSSLPGTNGTTSNGTGSDTPGTPGASNGERNHDTTATGGVNNDYSGSDIATVTMGAGDRTKSLVATSEAHTSDTETGGSLATARPVAIGEIVRYRLVYQIPEGTTPDFMIRDRFAPATAANIAGQQFIPGSARYAFVANSGLSSSTSGGVTGLTCTNIVGNFTLAQAAATASISSVSISCTFNDDNISSAEASNNDTYGRDVYFKFGSVFNNDPVSNPGDTNLEFVIVEFNALVDNNRTDPLIYNDNGDSLTDTLQARYRNPATGNMNNLQGVITRYLKVVEPNIPFNGVAGNQKTASPISNVDSGDTVNYTIEYTNTGTTDAYEVVITDNMAALPFNNVTYTNTTFGGGCSAPGAASTTGSTATQLVVTISHVSPTCLVTITYTATATTAIAPFTTYTNTASIRYSSLPGTNGTIGNSTGSNTPGTPGSTTGERNHDTGASGGANNDYTGSDTAQVTAANVTPVKSIIATSETSTSDSTTDTALDPRPLAIGEIMRYRLSVALPEGTSTNFIVTDVIPAGLTFVPNTLTLDYIADSPVTNTDPTANTDLNGANGVPAFYLPSSYFSLAGQTLTINLQSPVNNDLNDGNAEYVVLDFNVLVNNDATNNNTTIHDNLFNVTINGGAAVSSNHVFSRVDEPLLLLDKSAIADTNWKYGDTVTYTLALTSNPASAADAFNLRIVDTIPSTLTYVASSITAPAGWLAVDSAAPSLVWICDSACSLPKGGIASFTYQATVNPTTAPIHLNGNDTAVNNATLTWTSLPGTGTTPNGTGSATPGASGAPDGERNGSGGVNKYTDPATHSGHLIEYYSIGNRVWFDTNNNSLMDASEVGVPNVDVELYAADGSGNPSGARLDLDTTNAAGFYLFDYLLPGDYVVAIPASEIDAGGTLEGYWSSATSINGVAVISETAAPDADVVAADADDNGTLVAGRVISAAVTLGLSGLTEPTDEIAAQLESGVLGSQGAQPDGRANMTVDFGFYKTEIGNLVYFDTNVNGTYDSGTDTLISGATVKLYAANGTTEILVGADGILGTADDGSGGVLTNGSGLYQFSGLPAGDYIVQVGTPADMLSTIDSFDGADNANPDINTDNNDNGIGISNGSVASGALTMTGGEILPNITVNNASGTTSDNTVDFGFIHAYALGNRVWFDTDNSNTINGSEVGVNGVIVDLYRADGLGNPTGSAIATDTTSNGGANDGYYLFDYLIPGDYVVVIRASNLTGAGVLSGYWSSGTSRNADGSLSETAAPDANTTPSDVDDNGALQTAAPLIGAVISKAVTLGPVGLTEPTGETDLESGSQGDQPDGRANMTVDFGFYSMSLGNLVWSDTDKNGAFNGGESGITGVPVTLWSGDGTLQLASTTTAAGGIYSFIGLSQGDYIVRVTAPTGTISSVDTFASADTTNPTTNTDSNDNGVGTGTGTVSSNIVTLTPGLPQTSNTVDNLTGSTVNPSLDFGFVPVFSLGNRVWFDTDNSSAINGESGVAGVTVQLFASDGVTEIPVGPDGILGTLDDSSGGMLTDNGGYYLFNNLLAGDYMVVIPASNFDILSTNHKLAGYWSSATTRTNTGAITETTAAPANSDIDSDDNGTLQTSGSLSGAVVSSVVTLGPATTSEPAGETDLGPGGQGQPNTQANMTVDFGFYTIQLGNLVWNDANTSNNGLFESAREAGIDGVHVQLWTADGLILLNTITTSGGGIYTFTGLPQGNYLVRIPASEFNPGGVLRDYVSSTGAAPFPYEPAPNPDADMMDSDDNGTEVTTGGVLGLGGYIQSSVFALTPAGEQSFSNTDGSTTEFCVDFGVYMSQRTDLAITKDDGVTQYIPGTSITYTITVNNVGPSDALNATVSDTFPAGVTATWTCSGSVAGATCTAGGSGDISDTVNIPAGASITYTVMANIASSVTGNLTNTTTVSHPADTNSSNNSASDTDTQNSQADLSATKNDGVLMYIPGGTLTYAITVSNAGPSNAPGSLVSDTIPPQVSSWAWVCAGATGGATGCDGAASNFSDTVDFPAGSSITYTVTANIASSATGNLTNTVTVTPPSGVTDLTPGNNTASDTDTQNSQVDLSVTKDDGVTQYIPGTSVTYAIVVSNTGLSDALGSIVSDSIPAQISSWTWACSGVTGTASGCDPYGPGALNFSDTVDLPAGSSITYTVTAQTDPAATTNLVNTAATIPPSGITDTTPSDNTAVDTDMPNPQVDLSVTKDDGVANYIPGGTLTYTITVSNAGPSNAPASLIGDNIPAQFSSWIWVCSGATGGATGCDGAASNSSNFSDTVNLPASSSITYTVTVNIAPSVSGALINTVSVTPPVGVTDTDNTNNTATDTDTQNSQADLSVTKDDGVLIYVPGVGLNYTIVVMNAGPSDALGVSVSDPKPIQISSWDWTCITTGSATCTPQPALAGDFTDTVNMPAGSIITYTVVATIPSSASGELVNTVTISHPTDSTPGDNTADDVDQPASLLVTKDDNISIVSPGSVLSYNIVLTNNGLVNLTSITVADTLPADLTYQNATPAPSTVTGNALTWSGLSLAHGASTTITVTAVVNDPPSGTSIANVVTATDTTTGVTDTDDDVDTITSGLTKSLAGTDAAHTTDPQVAIGEVLTYEVVMSVPSGSMDLAKLVDIPQTGLAFVDLLSLTVSDPDTDGAGAGDTGIYSSVMTFDGTTGACTNCVDGINPASSNPLIENHGGKATFDFGTLTNSSGTAGTITIRYSVVVLDISANQDGTSLTNHVTWSWSGGSLTATATIVEIVEPDLFINKNVNTSEAPYGSTVIFTIDVAHTVDSSANAYDVVVVDVLPAGLQYVPGSLIFSGLSPTTSDYDPDTTTLTFVWDVFPLGQTITITFQAVFVGPSPVVNSTNVVWTSLPIDPGTGGPIVISTYNTDSTERWYAPGDSTDDYGATGSTTLSVTNLPETGFAPGVVTELPPQPNSLNYTDLGDFWLEIPKLGVKLPIVGVPLNGKGWNLTWLDDQAGWLEGTAYPTHAGNSVITSHVYLANGAPGPFINLSKLYWGQTIIVHLGGQKYIYEVREVREVKPDDNRVFKHEDYAWLTLVTCKDYNEKTDTYAKRVAVRAVLVSVESE